MVGNLFVPQKVLKWFGVAVGKSGGRDLVLFVVLPEFGVTFWGRYYRATGWDSKSNIYRYMEMMYT